MNEVRGSFLYLNCSRCPKITHRTLIAERGHFPRLHANQYFTKVHPMVLEVVRIPA
jgi:hypothetical protein